MVSSAKLNQQEEKAMTTDQFNQVVGAILEGKYSWACVLILRFAGYNPLHYVPYRTYNRLMKANGQFHRVATKGHRKEQIRTHDERWTNEDKSPMNRASRNEQKGPIINDLNHLEELTSHAKRVRGGISLYPSAIISSLIW